jgi:hypothetical protein
MLWWHGRTEDVTLGAVAVQGGELVKLVGAFDSLGDGFDADDSSELDHGPCECGSLPAVRDAVDEALVDLDGAYGEVL